MLHVLGTYKPYAFALEGKDKSLKMNKHTQGFNIERI